MLKVHIHTFILLLQKRAMRCSRAGRTDRSTADAGEILQMRAARGQTRAGGTSPQGAAAIYSAPETWGLTHILADS